MEAIDEEAKVRGDFGRGVVGPGGAQWEQHLPMTQEVLLIWSFCNDLDSKFARSYAQQELTQVAAEDWGHQLQPAGLQRTGRPAKSTAAMFQASPASFTHPKAFSHSLLPACLPALSTQVVPDGPGALADTGQAGKKDTGRKGRG